MKRILAVESIIGDFVLVHAQGWRWAVAKWVYASLKHRTCTGSYLYFPLVPLSSDKLNVGTGLSKYGYMRHPNIEHASGKHTCVRSLRELESPRGWESVMQRILERNGAYTRVPPLAQG